MLYNLDTSLAQGRKSFKIKPLSFRNKGNRQVLRKGSDDTDSKMRMSQGRRRSLQTSQINLGSPDQNFDLTDDVFLGNLNFMPPLLGMTNCLLPDANTSDTSSNVILYENYLLLKTLK